MDGLVQVRDDELRAVSAMGMGLSLDPQASEQVGKLLRISEFFYGKGGASWKGVAASISARADPRAHVVLRLGAQVLDIPNGTERKLTTRWPQPGQDGATLQATTVNRTFEEKREGQWALLRLMESRTPGSPEATWSFNDRSYIVDIPVSVKLDALGGPFQDREFLHVALLQDLFL
jgi:type VI protein secretion system component VasK